MRHGVSVKAEAAVPVAGPIRLCSWPGRDFAGNRFVPQFLGAVESAGLTVSGVDWPSQTLARPCDVVMFHWLDWVFWGGDGAGRKLRRAASLLRTLARLPRRTVLVWVVHNVEPHDRGLADRLLWSVLVRAVAMRADGFVTLSPCTVPVVRRAVPALAHKPAIGVQHPLYPIATGAAAEAARLREAAGISPDDRLAGYAGLLRGYKGLEQLVKAFRDLGNRRSWLMLSGQDRGGTAAALRAMAGDSDRIAIESGTFPDEAFDARLTACDLVVAPYRKYLHSGAMLHALSAGRPILTPATPFSLGLRDAIGGNWVTVYRGALTPAILSDALANLPGEGRPDLSAFGQDQIGRQVAGFLRTLCRTRQAAVRSTARRPRIGGQKIWNT